MCGSTRQRAYQHASSLALCLLSITVNCCCYLQPNTALLLCIKQEPERSILLISRLCLQELSTQELCQVLVAPKNALSRQYSKQFDMSDAHLHITSKAMQAIAVIAKDKGTGARGLRSIMEKLLMDAMFEVSIQTFSFD